LISPISGRDGSFDDLFSGKILKIRPDNYKPFYWTMLFPATKKQEKNIEATGILSNLPLFQEAGTVFSTVFIPTRKCLVARLDGR